MGQNQWYHFGVGAPLILEPILVGIGMFTGGTIWILTHGQVVGMRRGWRPPFDLRRQPTPPAKWITWVCGDPKNCQWVSCWFPKVRRSNHFLLPSRRKLQEGCFDVRSCDPPGMLGGRLTPGGWGGGGGWKYGASIRANQAHKFPYTPGKLTSGAKK